MDSSPVVGPVILRSPEPAVGRPGVWYAIDEADRLMEASEAYFDFAGQNEYPTAGLCVGSLLWDSVSDSTTRLVQRSLVRRVRRFGRTLTLPFRCDGPSVRRELTLEIGRRAETGWIQFSAATISEVQRPRQALLDLGQARGDRTITMCSWCDRFMVDRVWVEIEQAVSDLGLTKGSDLPSITYALCDRCDGMLSGV
jgi:hypothetical protein